MPVVTNYVAPDCLFAPVGEGKAAQNKEMDTLIALLPVAYQQKESVLKLVAEFFFKHSFDYVARNIDYPKIPPSI